MSTKIGMQFDSDAGYVGCGLQICSHPACWEAAKRINRELQIKNFAHSRKKIFNHKPKIKNFSQEYATTVETPTLSILNLLKESDDYRPTSPSTVSHKETSFLQSLANLPPHDSDVLTKLQLKSLTQDSTSGFTPAPANTPLHSSHRLEALASQRSGIMTESLNQSQKQSSQGQSSHSAQHSVRNMVLNFHHGEKKKILQWKSKRNEEMGQGDAHANIASKKKVASGLFLPLESLPVQPHETSWKNTKTKKSLKPIHFTNITVPIELSSSTLSNASSKRGKSARKRHTKQTSTHIPREIERLRLVPIDVLLRVVKMALHNKVLTMDQADVLMYQVTGQKYLFYEENSPSDHTITKTNLYLTSQKKVHTPRDSKKSAATLALNTPSVYKLDAANAEIEKKVQKKQQENRVISRQKLKPIDEILFRSRSEEIPPRGESPSKVHASAIKSTVGCVVKDTDEIPLSSPTKPFHYQKASHDMCLHPLPTPLPASPSTERDSKYNEILGGSTVLVNPSRTNSLTTFERPLSGSSFTSRKRGSLMNGVNDYVTISSTKSTVWPQVDEGFYVENNDSEAVVPADPSPLELEKLSPAVDENKLPALTEGSSETQQTVESSPVPPPPSPVVPHSKDHKDETKEDSQE